MVKDWAGFPGPTAPTFRKDAFEGRCPNGTLGYRASVMAAPPKKSSARSFVHWPRPPEVRAPKPHDARPAAARSSWTMGPLNGTQADGFSGAPAMRRTDPGPAYAE